MSKMPSKWQIVEHWTDYFFSLSLEEQEKYPGSAFIDIGEPDCWACGRYDPNFNDIWRYCEYIGLPEDAHKIDENNTLLKNMWNDASLERHHILPKSRGGKNDCHNLFLLCKKCHKEAPHTVSYEYFIMWARNRKNEIQQRYIDAIKNAAQFNGIDYDKNDKFIGNLLLILNFNGHPLCDELDKYISKNVSFHMFGDRLSWFRDAITLSIQYAIKNEWDVDTMSKIYNDFLEREFIKLKELK